jgi:hypothetical protein
MLVDPLRCCVANTASTLAKIPFAYKRASASFRNEIVCPIYEQSRRAVDFFYAATAYFDRGGA